jgi:hypothetical protein
MNITPCQIKILQIIWYCVIGYLAVGAIMFFYVITHWEEICVEAIRQERDDKNGTTTQS